MPTYSWTLCTLSLYEAVSVHHSQTPALTEINKLGSIKKELYIRTKQNANDMQIRNQYKKHCNILKNEIIKTKKQHYHELIMKASNKAKAAWDIIHRNSRKGDTGWNYQD